LKYLITGGAGFIGSHLVDLLIAEGNEVVVFDDFSTGSRDNLKQHFESKLLKVIEGSILNPNELQSAIAGVDRIIHLAAAVGVFNIVQHPLKSLRTNITGSENVFDLALEQKLPVLIASSSEVYGKNNADSLSEDADRIIGAPQKIRWSYSDAKAIDESMAVAMNMQAGLETRIVRLFNTVGPRQVGRYGMVVPRFVSAAIKNEPIEIYGTGKQTRCFGHVYDISRAILAVDRCHEAIGKPINLGVNQEISILNLAQRVKELTGSQSEIVFKSYGEVYAMGFEDMERRVPDNSLLKNLTGWQDTKKIEDIIRDIADSIR
jgi:UDP-glucose 4-epimerase